MAADAPGGVYDGSAVDGRPAVPVVGGHGLVPVRVDDLGLVAEGVVAEVVTGRVDVAVGEAYVEVSTGGPVSVTRLPFWS